MIKYISLIFLFTVSSYAQVKLLIPMEPWQTNHLKAYGIAYRCLLNEKELDWLLNYRGGAFMFKYSNELENECIAKNVSYELLDGSQAAEVYSTVQSAEYNMELVHLEKAAKICVYVPPNTLPWDDAVQLVLEYAEIPYDKLWDEEVLTGKLQSYDWIHLHHEDFTGQFGKFFTNFSYAQWYIDQMKVNKDMASKLGFNKVSQLKLAVVKKLNEYIANGGFMFCMCLATDTYDVSLAAQNTDIAESMYDGDAADPNANSKLVFDECIAFQDFQVELNPYDGRCSNIDITYDIMNIGQNNDFFKLVEFSAKFDPVPTMLTQCHTALIKGFMGKTSGFHEKYIKPGITILAKNEGTDLVRYIHGNFGKGTFTMFAGHDPEDYQHLVGAPKTDLNTHPNSPGYRLILNNVLFPAAKKKKLKT